jgi:hypothetical protein
MLLHMFKYVMLVHNPIVVGKVPIKPFRTSVTFFRPVHKPMSAGIEPRQ